jgi:hypothetical protein
MRFMMVVKGPENAGAPPKALMDAIEKMTAEAIQSGKIVSFGGLHPTAAGFKVRSANGKLTVTDGPFTEAKEVIGGFAIYEYESKEEAIEAVRGFMEVHRLHWPSWNGETEVRQLFGHYVGQHASLEGEPDFAQK